VQDRGAECVDDFAGMQVVGLAERGGDVEVRGLAFEHTVGDEDEPVTGRQL
jgi:hypothetical protein